MSPNIASDPIIAPFNCNNTCCAAEDTKNSINDAPDAIPIADATSAIIDDNFNPNPNFNPNNVVTFFASAFSTFFDNKSIGWKFRYCFDSAKDNTLSKISNFCI